MRRYASQFVWSVLSASLLSSLLWGMREILVSHAWISQYTILSAVLSYERFMMIGIVLFGLPIGGALGMFLRHSALEHARPSGKAFLFAMLFGIVAMGTLIGLRVIVERIPCSPWVLFLRGDVFLLIVACVAGLCCAIGYNLGFNAQMPPRKV